MSPLEKVAQMEGITHNFRAATPRPFKGNLCAATPLQSEAFCAFFHISMQIVENSYSKGLSSVSFETDGDGFLIDYTENGAAYKIPAGFYKPEETELNINGDMFRIRTAAQIETDLRGRIILRTRTDFIELPVTRYLDFIITEDTVTVRHDETPDCGLVFSIVKSQIDQMNNPLLNGIAGLADPASLMNTCKRIYMPEITLRRSNDTADA